jgi:phosphatidylserine/phosphatidylglycerophosphate/cardiolipin synthase-like enzyme
MTNCASSWPDGPRATEPDDAGSRVADHARFFLADPDAPVAEARITPLIDGADYTAALRAALRTVGTGPSTADNAGQLVLVAGWWLGLTSGLPQLVQGPIRRRLGMADALLRDGPPFCLDPWPAGAVPFTDPPDRSSALLPILREKARAGVDVRVLGWVSTATARSRLARLLGAGEVVAINTLTIRSVAALRAEPAIGAKAVLNTIGHAVGSCHSKIVLVCDGQRTVAFTGGIDLQLSRWARHGHAGAESWHDVVAQIEGPAVQGVYDHFREMWAENLARPAHRYRLDGARVDSWLPGTPPLPARTLPVEPAARGQHAQALQTLPAARFRRLRIGPRSRPLRAAPTGRFTYRAAIRHAILLASRYVYVEDQFLWSREVMSWLNQAVRANPGLHVILLMSGRDNPDDPPLPRATYHGHAVYGGLLPGLTPEQRSRVAVFERDGIIVHAKTVLVDDAWAAIGSGNIAQRSLYTDIEQGVAVVDDAGELVRGYRSRLWAHHFRHDTPAAFAALPAALHAWRPDWGRPGAAPARPAWLRPLPLPATPPPFPWWHRWLHASFHDCDSRRPWSGLAATRRG